MTGTDTIGRRAFLARAAAAAALPIGGFAGATSLAPRPPEGARVLVLGAGLAGLAAALELLEQGHRPTLLEARARVGGRVHTLRGLFTDGARVEAGATFVPGNHAHTLGFARTLAVPLERVAAARGAGRRYFLRGRTLVTGSGAPPRWPLALRADERGMDPQLMRERLLAPVLERLGDPTHPSWPGAQAARYDALTLAELLAARGASQGAIELMSLGYLSEWGDGPAACSALSILRDLAQQGAPAHVFRIAGGSDRLPEAMAARLGSRVELNSEVVAIQQDAASVRVQLRRRSGQFVERRGDFAVCALPVPCLRRVRVTPGLEPGLRSALATLRSTSVTRVFLQLGRRCWPAGGVVVTDLPLMLLAEATAGEAAHPVLEAFVTGAQARALASLPESERIARVRAWAERIQPGVARAFTRGASYVWDHDRWAGGDYAWFAPGELTAFTPLLARPHGRIHFAGDHTSSLPGWMEGALASGVRAAREVQRAWARAH